MPIVQNLWAVLERGSNKGFSEEVFAKKMKWFFVANIIWAVWHAIEDNLPPEDIVLGLLTVAMSSLSSFDYKGKWITFSNSEAFTDYMLGVYTVWNYRFVKQWASNNNPADQWMHVSVALSMPIIEAMANHGDVRYYINYRRDDLFAAMLLMLERQQKEEQDIIDGRCCCDWDTNPSFFQRVWETPHFKDWDAEEMKDLQRCIVVPDHATKWNGKCPSVERSAWVDLGSREELYTWSSEEYLQLHHDDLGCKDRSKIIKVPQISLR